MFVKLKTAKSGEVTLVVDLRLHGLKKISRKGGIVIFQVLYSVLYRLKQWRSKQVLLLVLAVVGLSGGVLGTIVMYPRVTQAEANRSVLNINRHLAVWPESIEFFPTEKKVMLGQNVSVTPFSQPIGQGGTTVIRANVDLNTITVGHRAIITGTNNGQYTYTVLSVDRKTESELAQMFALTKEQVLIVSPEAWTNYSLVLGLVPLAE